MSTSDASYSPPAKIFHWLTVLCVFAAWGLGFTLEDLPAGSIRQLGKFIHIQIGETVVLLVVLRLVWRFITPPPPPQSTELGVAGAIATRVAHLALYVLLLAVPVVGVVVVFHGGDALPVYGLYDIPSPWPKNRELKHSSKEIHELLAHLLVILALLHAAAALAHHYVFKDRVLARMMPKLLVGE